MRVTLAGPNVAASPGPYAIQVVQHRGGGPAPAAALGLGPWRPDGGAAEGEAVEEPLEACQNRETVSSLLMRGLFLTNQTPPGGR